MAYRQSFETCPRCGVALADAGAVRACSACNGQWIEEPVLAEMVMAMLPAGVLGELVLLPSARPAAIACPSCAAPMEAVSLCGVELDRCRAHHGVWFDPEELQTGLWQYAKNPTRVVPLPEPPPLPPEPPPPPAPPVLEPALAPAPVPAAAPEPAPDPALDARIAALVADMRSGVRFRVGSAEYRWDSGNGVIVVEGTAMRALSDRQLRRVVVEHPDLFDVPKARLRAVIEQLKGGKIIQWGGGRSFEVFGWDPGTRQLYCEVVVDGIEERGALSERRLAEAIAEAPSIFGFVRDE